MQYISLGSDCSSAAALKNLGLRDYALPFDWISSDPSKIYTCIMDDFKGFHRNLTLNDEETRLVDEYGFEFPHDYPTSTQSEVGEGTVHEATIIVGWEKCHDIVLEKYKRRVERFKNILSSTAPIIAVFRGDPSHIYCFREAFLEKYNKENIVYVVSSNRPCDSNDIIVCNTENKGDWNSTDIWLDAISNAKEKINGLTV